MVIDVYEQMGRDPKTVSVLVLPRVGETIVLDGRSAVVRRVVHSIRDGVAHVGLVLAEDPDLAGRGARESRPSDRSGETRFEPDPAAIRDRAIEDRHIDQRGPEDRR